MESLLWQLKKHRLQWQSINQSFSWVLTGWVRPHLIYHPIIDHWVVLWEGLIFNIYMRWVDLFLNSFYFLGSWLDWWRALPHMSCWVWRCTTKGNNTCIHDFEVGQISLDNPVILIALGVFKNSASSYPSYMHSIFHILKIWGFSCVFFFLPPLNSLLFWLYISKISLANIQSTFCCDCHNCVNYTHSWKHMKLKVGNLRQTFYTYWSV